jgi:transposase
MMLKSASEYDRIYIACGATDLRKSVDGLCGIIRDEFKLDPFENCLFMFCNGSRNRMKALSWDRNGFCLYYKRLDGQGARYAWPKEGEGPRSIGMEQLKKLLEGMSIDPPRGFGDITARDF